MAIYSMADRSALLTTANASFEVRTTASIRANVLENGITINAATASVYGLGRPAAIGVTPTSPKTGLAEDQGGPTGSASTAVAWGTGPTVPANFFRRVSLPATIGAGIIWTFPRGIVVSVSNSLVDWNLTAVSAADMWFVWDE